MIIMMMMTMMKLTFTPLTFNYMYITTTGKYELPAGNILHGHAQCFDLKLGAHSSWAMREGTFLDFEGKELKDFEKAVEYHSQTGLDVFIWWEVLTLEPPVIGWDDDKDGICSVESCWGKIKRRWACY